MTRRVVERIRRPVGMALSDDEGQRERSCKALASDGFDVLAFLDTRSAQDWLEEVTPEVAIDPCRPREPLSALLRRSRSSAVRQLGSDGKWTAHFRRA